MCTKMFSHVVAFLIVPVFAMVQVDRSENPTIPLILSSNFIIYNSSNEVFHACFKLESNKTICANSSKTHLQVKNRDGHVIFDIRESSNYQFRRIGNVSLLKFKNDSVEKKLLVNDLVFDNPEQIDPSNLSDVDEHEVEIQAKELMKSGDIDSMIPLADSIDKLDLNKEQQKTIRPFLVLAMITMRGERSLKASGELKLNDSTYILNRIHQKDKIRYKRSACLREPEEDDCAGLCGPGCWCWKWVCGDCCFHQGCYDHDKCCDGWKFLSAGCLLRIYNFRCSGYPNCGRGSCFPAEATVQRKNSEIKTLVKDLQVGDEVLTVDNEGKEVYTKVLEFLHHEFSLSTKYLEIQLSDGDILTISKRHLVFKQNNDAKIAVLAVEVQIGDYLFKHMKKRLQPLKVVSIEEKNAQGAFAPLTDQGTLLIDGVLVSCYAQIRSHRLAHFALTPLRMWRLWFPSKEVRNGIHWYAKQLMKGLDEIKPFLPEMVSGFL